MRHHMPPLIPAVFPAAIAAAVMAVLIIFDIANPMGAHPWWSQKSLLIGAPFGLTLATLASYAIRSTPRILFWALATLAAYAAAKSGGIQFAASYGEDATAGKLWFFGWIGTGAALAGWLTTLIQVLKSRATLN